MFMLSLARKRLSCGVLILNGERELLLCHVTGQHHWDLPKGGLQAGESPLDAALRETAEESGLRLDAAALLDLGRFEYRPRKDLHLFATLMPRFDLATLHCDSQFSDLASGRRLPEMDGFAWFDFAEVPRHCGGRMATVLSHKIDLGRLYERLTSTRVIANATAAPAVRPAQLAVARPVERLGDAR